MNESFWQDVLIRRGEYQTSGPGQHPLPRTVAATSRESNVSMTVRQGLGVAWSWLCYILLRNNLQRVPIMSNYRGRVRGNLWGSLVLLC